jgi:hypothetical protein
MNANGFRNYQADIDTVFFIVPLGEQAILPLGLHSIEVEEELPPFIACN